MAETVFKHFVATSAPPPHKETRWDDFIKTYKAKTGAAVR